MTKLSDEELESKLREFFDSNYEYLKETSGHAINEVMKERAYEQVLMYLKKNREMLINGKISSIKISIPDQKTKTKNIPYSIEGKIDILDEDGEITLFDITTAPIEQIEENIDSYKEELNLYANELNKMKFGPIKDMAVLSTAIPNDVRYAFRTNNLPEFETSLKIWNQFVLIEHDEEIQEEALKNIGEVVEKICNCQFEPPRSEDLMKEFKDGKYFYNHVCDNCDIRKSCESYKNMKHVNKLYIGNHTES